MKYAVLFVSCFFLTVSAVHGETKYVTDVFEIMVRTGPDLSHKIIAMPKSGTPVEIVGAPDEERVDEWVKVRLSNGNEGWVLSQFLVSGPPKKEIISKLEGENQTLKLRKKTLSEENARLKADRRELGKALAQQTKKGGTLKESYETLKRESKEFLALKASYERASQELRTKTTQVKGLEKEVEGLRRGQTLRWFIAGASIILVGFVIGYVSRRPKRRSSLL